MEGNELSFFRTAPVGVTVTLKPEDRLLIDLKTAHVLFDDQQLGIHAGLSAQPLIVEDDPVNHPKHYTSHPSGIECIQVTRHLSFNIGNVIKYCWRTDHKNGVEDLEKAAWYLADEIKRLKGLK